MRRFVVLVPILLGLCASGCGTPVKGRVVHALSKRAMADCTVVADVGGKKTTTNKDGAFQINLKVQKYVITATCGTSVGKVEVDVPKGQKEVAAGDIMVAPTVRSATGIWVSHDEDLEPVESGVTLPNGFSADIERSLMRDLHDGCSGIQKCQGFFGQQRLPAFRLSSEFMRDSGGKAKVIKRGSVMMWSRNGGPLAVPLVRRSAQQIPCKFMDCSGGWNPFQMPEGYWAGLVDVRTGPEQNNYGVTINGATGKFESYPLSSEGSIQTGQGRLEMGRVSLAQGYYCLTQTTNKLSSGSECILIKVVD